MRVTMVSEESLDVMEMGSSAQKVVIVWLPCCREFNLSQCVKLRKWATGGVKTTAGDDGHVGVALNAVTEQSMAEPEMGMPFIIGLWLKACSGSWELGAWREVWQQPRHCLS